MSAFRRALSAALSSQPTPTRRGQAVAPKRWLFVPYDQLTDGVGPLSREDPSTLGIVLVECPGKASRRPYHKQKLALVLTNLRHFALEQAARGVSVRHEVASSYAGALKVVAKETGPLRMMRPAERELRAELSALVTSGDIEEVPHEGWLTTTADFQASHGAPPWRMDAFYKHVRARLRILTDAKGMPSGGKWSFDSENRKRWPGVPTAPEPPRFEVDAITAEVCDLIRERFAHHPGRLTPTSLPATKEDAERLWAFAKVACLPHFGPFEDAMSTASRSLFHTRISPLLNNLRLLATQVVEEASAMDSLPIASKEGFVRQILGWREYMRHVHEATDGFRVIEGKRQSLASEPGDGGWSQWQGRPFGKTNSNSNDTNADDAKRDGGSLTSVLGADRHVPPAYWGKASGLRCLDDVVTSVWEDGQSHHITRLMVLANIATLLDVSPREITDWFWVAYIDAYDWVVEPNVHGMGTFGLGSLFTTKPYIAGSAYINKMSDYCKGCRFDPKTTCPLTPLYWAYLGRHREALAKVPRMMLPIASEARRTGAQRDADASMFEHVARELAAGHELKPTKA